MLGVPTHAYLNMGDEAYFLLYQFLLTPYIRGSYDAVITNPSVTDVSSLVLCYSYTQVVAILLLYSFLSVKLKSTEVYFIGSSNLMDILASKFIAVMLNQCDHCTCNT